MYKNQYLITDQKLPNKFELKVHSFNKLVIYAHPSLPVTKSTCRASVILLGYILNPLKPGQSNDDIIREIGEACTTKESLFNTLQHLSGRYVLLYKNDSDFIAVNDACALKQLYYGFFDGHSVLTSSAKMFLDLYREDPLISDEKKELMASKHYEQNEWAWIGDKCIDDRLKKVLPNHFLNILEKRTERCPLNSSELVSEPNVIEYSAAIFKGSIDAITRRHQVIQTLTAGWESRILLAASKEFKDKINYFVFEFGKLDGFHPDIYIPRKLSLKLDLNFSVIKTQELKSEFLDEYRKEHMVPRLLPYTTHIQYHYYNHADRNIIRISGNVGGVFKCFYGYTKRPVTAEMLEYFSGFEGKSRFVNQEIALWYTAAREYAHQYKIPLLDLFYWEQRIGNWGALYDFEQDIAIEEFCPYSNRNLIASMLRTDPRKRSQPNCSILKEVIKHLWEECATVPINPCGFVQYLRKGAKRNSVLKYYNLKAKSLFGHSSARPEPVVSR